MLSTGEPPSSDDDGRVTVRASRSSIALVAALVIHALLIFLMMLLPKPDPPKNRIQITLAPTPPKPLPPAMSPKPRPPRATAPPQKSKPIAEPPKRVTSPVLPELPPTETPAPNQAELPMAEKSPEPAPPPEPTTWKERLLAQLSSTRPHPPRLPTGPLAPSVANLERVALSDARLHDDELEQRMAEDFGPFFRRGLEQLRSNWHPDEVLDKTERDPTKRCGHSKRVTFAVAVLDHDGNVVDVELKNPSGCPDLDSEAIAAFKRVAQFPHPPAGIFVGPDGTPMEHARYPVRFIVTFEGPLQLMWQ